MTAISRRRLLAGGAGALATAALAACGTDTSSRYDTGYVAGDGVTTEIAPEDRGEPLEFSGTTLDGQAFDAAGVRGDVLVVNVWYASCAPCREEAPDLKAVAEEYAGKGVSFIGVNVRDEAGPAQAFEQTFGVPYPSLADPDSSVLYALRGQVAPNAVPSTVVLDREGRPAARISGAIDPSTLRAMLDRVLAE